jgi:hypothetical protein
MFCIVADAASAQGRGRGGGPRLSPEDSAAAWKAQAKGVAKSVGISGENEGKLVSAYSDARKAHREAARAARGEGGSGDGGGRARFAMSQQLAAKHGKQLSKTLGAFLDDDKAKKAAASLGSFNRQWDGYVNTVLGYKLGEKEQSKALSLVAAYITESGRLRTEARESEDGFRGMREKFRAMKTKLDEDMASVLSEEQSKAWNESTAPRRRGGGGGRPGGRRGGGGGGGDGGGE